MPKLQLKQRPSHLDYILEPTRLGISTPNYPRHTAQETSYKSAVTFFIET